MANFLLAPAQPHNIKDYQLILVVCPLGSRVPSLPVPILSHGDDSESFNYEHITAEKNTVKEDCVGNAHWSLNPGESGKVKLKMMSTNPDNALIQARYAIVSPVGTFRNTNPFHLTIKGNNTTPGQDILLQGLYGRVEGPPAAGRGKDVGSVEWTLTFSKLLINEVGVNA